MKIKKLLAMLLSVVTAFTCFAVVGCGGNEGTGSGGGDTYDPTKTVNLQTGSGGYGDAYLKELIAKFEELHKDKGWRINLLDPLVDFGTTNAAQQMYQGAEATGWDLVFPGSVFVWDVVNDDMGVAVESLTDLYEQTPVGFDGTPERITLKDKVDLPEHFRWAIAMGENYEDYYGFSQVGSARGVGVNTAVLREFGFEYGNDATTPMYTTAQFLDVVYGIYYASKTTPNKQTMYPMIFGGDNAATYSVSTYTVQHAENLGREEYMKRNLNWMLEEYNGIPVDGYKYFTERYDRQPTMEYVAATWDYMAAMTGSGSMRHTDAHYKLATGKAAFMFDGNYLYNEIKTAGATVDDMRFMHAPTSSFVGVKNDLCGAGHDENNNMGTHFSGKVEGFSAGLDFCADCDERLAYICKLTDDGYTAEQILDMASAEGYDFTEDQVKNVMFARTVYYGGFTSGGYIMKDCGVEHIAKEFLRMLASDDAAQLYAKYGMMSAFRGDVEVEIGNDQPQMLKDVFKLMDQQKGGFMVYCHSEPGTVANRMNTGAWGKTYDATMGKQINSHSSMVILNDTTLESRDYTSIAIALIADADKDLKNNWEENITLAQLNKSESSYMG